ncbi:Proteasome maturation protein isoform 2 [Schistosoma japonicum]|uniref:Proteasome maturation protein isoform 2 n=1 Tax=Schistosoma japonicum TaxID=6182 RepID=A0A4Z2DA11_SCHJA|nr:Proteasome maturation protein isoform 2 [Schistosoma japonicum]TNN13352.1 Proteasome maturation protein isoform 2 [Schistosoma japonicum]TNN13353.1 Proteasome maturation protein isoform 2 [Schistosoma japonicum]TNN13354.1 Proteasome maturation protein isoform 2 [Schistosoma japonicum]TNN13356.1 Proteasome maturation protein isoform 2 [Schistosoma japonicum]
MSGNNKMLQPEFAVRPLLYTGLGDVVGSTVWSSKQASSLAAIPGSNVTDLTNFPHPVAESLAKYGKAAERANRMKVLTSAQGLHGPLRLSMEQRIMRRIQPRLPGLYSHHPLASQLSGSLDEIDVADFINPAEDSESVGMPHLMMEHKLGLL